VPPPAAYPIDNSLCLRFVTNEFRPYSEATIGASFMSKTVVVPGLPDDDDEGAAAAARGERHVGFKIWDTAGQEKYRSLAPMYYRGSQAAILVYDITKPGSLAALHEWADELRRNGPTDLVLAVCGNKSDLREDRLVDRRAGEDYARRLGAMYVETSAKDGDDVERLFAEVARKVPSRAQFEDEYLAEDGALDLGKPAEQSRGCC
jgi:small GTP-binding protein